MRKIIAIGGGEIGRKGVKNETLAIDREILNLSGKKNPKLLFVPTASGDAAGYIESVQKYFGEKLGCKIDTLELIAKKYSKKELEDKIFKTDIVYVGGGNTLKMMKVWRKLGVDKILERATKRGIVMAGLSAGSICWFRFGNSDSARFGKNKAASMIKVRGLGIVPALHCPHYDIEKGRNESLKEMMNKTSGVAIAIDNCAAIEIIGNEYRILKSKKAANAYKVYWKKGKYYREIIESREELEDLNKILIK